MKKYSVIIILCFLISLNNFYVNAQGYSDLPIKENYDKLFNTVFPENLLVLYNGLPYNCHNPEEVVFMAQNIGDRTDYVLKSLLRMYNTTKDKAYLIKFVNIAIKIQSERTDLCSTTIWQHPGWVVGNNSLYEDGAIIAAFAQYVYMVSNNDDLYNLSIPQNPNVLNEMPPVFSSLTFLTFGDFADWLNARVQETLNWYITSYWDNTNCFKTPENSDPDQDAAFVINQQAGFATALICIGYSYNGPNYNPYYEYRGKAYTIANRYRGTTKIYNKPGDVCVGSSILGECKIVPVMEPYDESIGGDSYYWYDAGWGGDKYGSSCNGGEFRKKCRQHYEFPQDLSHGIPVLQFPLAYYSIIPDVVFTADDMVKWRNMVTKRILFGYNSNTPYFHNNVMGGDDKIGTNHSCAPDNCPPNAFKNYSLGYMPFYQFDDNAHETPYVYNIIMDYYKYDFQNQNPVGSGTVDYDGVATLQGNQYYGLSEVVAAQWDKECVNLTLYNRDVVYDQDFTAKNILTIAPQQTSDANYTVTPFADPAVFTDGLSTDRFVIESGATVNMVAGERIVVKSGSSAKYGCHFHAYIDPSICTDGMKLTNQNNSDNNNYNETSQAPNKQKEKDKLLLVPNPNTGRFTVQIINYSSLSSNEVINKEVIKTITIYDMIGKVVYQSENTNQVHEVDIDISNFETGIYFIKVQSGDKIYTDKVIVE